MDESSKERAQQKPTPAEVEAVPTFLRKDPEPVFEPVPDAKALEHETEVQAQIDKNIEAAHASSGAMAGAFANAKPLNGNKKNGDIEKIIGNVAAKAPEGAPSPVKSAETTILPPELADVSKRMSDKERSNAGRLYNRLPKEKRGTFVAHVIEKQQDKETKRTAQLLRKVAKEKEKAAAKENTKSKRRPRKGSKKEKSYTHEEPAKLEHPWGSLGVYNELKGVDKELGDLYPNGVPNAVLSQYLSLRDRQVESFLKTVPEQRDVAAEAEAFIKEQRAKSANAIAEVPAALSDAEQPQANASPAQTNTQDQVGTNENNEDATKGVEEWESEGGATGEVRPRGDTRRKSFTGRAENTPEDEDRAITVPFSKEEQAFLDRSGEGTPKEWREKLRGLIEGAKEKANWYASSEDRLIRRSQELDKEVEKMGKVEGLFRSLGEKYNKMGWKSKLALGAGLGLGAGISAAVSLPALIGFTLGIGAQRAAGLATMYLKFEKTSSSKEKAMAKALVYTAAMSVGMAGLAYGVKEVAESDWGQNKIDWLKQHWPFGHAETKAQAPVQSPSQPPIGNLDTIPIKESPESDIPLTEAPNIFDEATTGTPTITAIPGQGYEYMAKQMWKQLQEHPLDLEALHKLPADSDIHKLVAADAATIDTVVHQIASDPQHGFYNPDGTSATVFLGSHMTIGTDGNIRLDGIEQAPEGASTTPPYHPETPASPSGTSAPASHTETPTADAVKAPDARSEMIASAESRPPAGAETIREAIPIPDPLQTIDTSSTTSDLTPAPEITRGAESVTNQHGLTILTGEPHIYMDQGAEHLLVYGGTPAEKAKMIGEYLLKNPDKILYSADDSGKHRIPWGLVEGEVVPGTPVPTGGFFGFFASWMSPPGPEEFEKIIK